MRAPLRDCDGLCRDCRFGASTVTDGNCAWANTSSAPITERTPGRSGKPLDESTCPDIQRP